jgi:type II secretory pathway component HofQ
MPSNRHGADARRIRHARAVADGETLVIPGLTHGRDVHETKAAGIKGGWFGRSTVVTHRRVELLILLTPRIVAGVAVQ